MLQISVHVKIKAKAGVCSSSRSVVNFKQGQKTLPRKGRRRGGEQESKRGPHTLKKKKNENQSITYKYLICIKEIF